MRQIYKWELPLTRPTSSSQDSLCDSVFIKSYERGRPHVPHHRKQRGGNSGEEHSLPDVGYWRTGVSQVLLEHLLLQYGGEEWNTLCTRRTTAQQMRETDVLSSCVSFFHERGSWCVCSEHRRQQGPPKVRGQRFTKGPD